MDKRIAVSTDPLLEEMMNGESMTQNDLNDIIGLVCEAYRIRKGSTSETLKAISDTLNYVTLRYLEDIK